MTSGQVGSFPDFANWIVDHPYTPSNPARLN
jgi:hypothetical protein